jgi:hypothetical protein
MRRRPNPWIAVPSLLLGVLAAVLGWVVTEVSCGQPDTTGVVGCAGWAALIAIVSFLVVSIGVAVLLGLVFRSLAEWQQRQ